MKLFLIKFEVTLGKGKSSLKLADEMLVPGTNEAEARSLFTSKLEKAGTLLMNQAVSGRMVRAIVPITQLNGKVRIVSCSKL